jgi:hypothetical protein
MTSKTREELLEMTPEERKAWAAAEEVNVFGVGFKRDRHGKPTEQGIGAPGNESEAHFRALAQAESQEVANKAREAALKRGYVPNAVEKL